MNLNEPSEPGPDALPAEDVGPESDSLGDDGSGDGEVSLAVTLEEFLGLAKSGMRPSREEFLARHPDRADALAECLDGLEFILSAAPQLGGDRTGSTGDHDGAEPAGAIMPSTRLGDYRIVREVGRGGMGVVFEAEQLSLGRKVALKVLPFAASLDPRQRQRFQLEAQAAAHLHHAHIVPVFAVGRDRGVHYYAMQFIDGRSLAAVVRELRRLAAKPPSSGSAHHRAEVLHTPHAPSNPPPDPASSETPGTSRDTPQRSTGVGTPQPDRDYFRAVARLGRQAAQALDHAHGLGVLHRDVKPGNLMIDGQGDLWVTDFGLARFLDEPGLTRTGDLIGTLAYMSPEQALGRREADHRGDIYSLGATLYELLTLRPPFEGRDRQELLRKIAHEEPIAPRRLDRSVPLDLETVVLKAMEKEPGARYPCARELAEELGRFLDDQPIRARRPGPIEHLTKWSRRHRTAVVTAATVLMLAMAVGTVLMVREKQHTEQARQALRQSFVKMVQVADVVLLKAMGLATETRLNAAKSTAAGARAAEEEARPIFEKAHDFYEMAAQQPETDDEMRALVAHATHRLAFTKMITRRPGAEATFRLSVAKYEALIARVKDVPLSRSGSESLFHAMMLDPGSPAAQRLKAIRMPPGKEHRLALADTLNDWAMLLGGAANSPAAGPIYRRAIAIREEVARTYPVLADELLALVRFETDWAAHLDLLKRPDEAREKRAALLAFTKSLVPRLPPWSGSHPELAAVLTAHGKDLLDKDRRRDAEVAFRIALELVPGHDVATNNLAWVLVTRPGSDLYDPAQAVVLAERAIASAPNAGVLWNTLGVAYYRAGNRAEAESALRRSMELRSGGDPNDWLFLAMNRWDAGVKTEANDLYDKSQSWMARNPNLAHDPDLQSFLRETAAKLGRPEPPAPPPMPPPIQSTARYSPAASIRANPPAKSGLASPRARPAPAVRLEVDGPDLPYPRR